MRLGRLLCLEGSAKRTVGEWLASGWSVAVSAQTRSPSAWRLRGFVVSDLR